MLEEKRNERPAIPSTKEEFNKWLEWHAKKENIYNWDFNFCFVMNGHTIRASRSFGHICIDNIIYSVLDEVVTICVNGVCHKPTEYIKLKVFS